jgi:serine/threonine protein kinase/Tol biopolymer transport system component
LKENNWEQVKDIFQAALDLAPGEREPFLGKACRNDETLRREVRELLDNFEENDSFFEQAAIGEAAAEIIAAVSVSSSPLSLKAGERYGRYKIKSALGAGGMSEVFLAEDTELERPVALKILSPDFTTDNDRVSRFVREAKSASALNHPNILIIHEIGRAGDLNFIATEYVEGETLRQRQRREALDLYEILDVAAQVASALSVAHEAKIIHRDIKPENIMLRADGLVKVLDFGLAKFIGKNRTPAAAVDSEAANAALVDTTPGMVMGTIAYMSPEQVRGLPTDARTDIWSLGVCLYELATGAKPFGGETPTDTIAAILKSQPLPLNPPAPAALNRIIRKALQKNREERYQTVRDLLIDLKDLRRDLDAETGLVKFAARANVNFQPAKLTDYKPTRQPTGSNIAGTASNVAGKSKINFFGAALKLTILSLALAAAGTVAYRFSSLANFRDSFQTMRLEKLTAAGNASDERVAVSPEGRYIAYVAQEGNLKSLWVRQVAADAGVQIIPPTEILFTGLTFSPDGDYIYYSMQAKKNFTALYKIPVLGGEVIKITENVESPVTFSPDGDRMAFVRREQLMIADADGSSETLLAKASDGGSWIFPAWSPDGKSIVSSVFSARNNNTQLVEVAVQDGSEKPLVAPGWLGISGVNWLPDASGIVIAGRDLETKVSQLWLMTYPEGKLSRITNDLNNYRGLSITADGRAIVSIQHERLSNIWISPDSAGADSAQRITFDKGKDEGMSGIAWTRDGRIVYTARVKGVPDLWIINRDGSENRQLTFNARSNFSPSVSPDNKYIAFVSDRSGSLNIWRMDLDGANAKPLTDSSGAVGFPDFSPDGKWIIYQFTGTDGLTTIRKIPSGGGAPLRLTSESSGNPVVSPDGRFFACNYGGGKADVPMKRAIVPFGGGEPVRLFDLPSAVESRNFRWTADGRALIFADTRSRTYNLWTQPLDDSPPKQLTNFNSDQIFRFDFSGDGYGFALARGYESSDVVMINNFR